MEKKYHFISGLPRTGSTILCNILSQNPRFRCDGVTSGLLDVIGMTRDNWQNIPEFKTWDCKDAQARVMRGMLKGFYADSDHPVVFDKSRGWSAHVEMAEMLIETKARILVPVRDMRAILSSWEKMFRKSKDLKSAELPAHVQSVEDRIKHWGGPGEPTGRAYIAIKDALQRGFEDRMLFIDFDNLCLRPEYEMKRIYTFLEEEYYPHDFDNIEQKNLEEDQLPWMIDLHKCQKKLAPIPQDWERILGRAADGAEGANNLWLFRT